MPVEAMPQSSISLKTLALHASAVFVALGVAALASHALEVRTADPAMTLTAAAPDAATPARIAGLIEPAIRASAEAAKPLLDAVAMEAQDQNQELLPPLPHAAPARPITPALARMAQSSTLPPLPQPRPCFECQDADASSSPAVQPVAFVDIAQDGPVPPLPVGAGADADVGPASLVLRGGQAVVEGSRQVIGTAWNLSGAAVDGLLRTVHRVSF